MYYSECFLVKNTPKPCVRAKIPKYIIFSGKKSLWYKKYLMTTKFISHSLAKVLISCEWLFAFEKENKVSDNPHWGVPPPPTCLDILPESILHVSNPGLDNTKSHSQKRKETPLRVWGWAGVLGTRRQKCSGPQEKKHLLGKDHSQLTAPNVPGEGQHRPWLSQSPLPQKKMFLLNLLLLPHRKGDGPSYPLFC